jgi:hypothetical protein
MGIVSAGRESEEGVTVASLQRELAKLRMERDAAIQQSREWQLRLSSVKAELDKERGSIERVVAAQGSDREREIRRELYAELSKSEAAWKERIRNERLLRLSYERVLLNLGFSPNRIASDLVRVSRPQPLTQDPEEYGTVNLLQTEAALLSQSQTRRKGMFAYGIDEIKSGMTKTKIVTGDTGPPKDETLRTSGSGRRDLLRSLSLATVPH